MATLLVAHTAGSRHHSSQTMSAQAMALAIAGPWRAFENRMSKSRARSAMMSRRNEISRGFNASKKTMRGRRPLARSDDGFKT